jgi:hypothetical protein
MQTLTLLYPALKYASLTNCNLEPAVSVNGFVGIVTVPVVLEVLNVILFGLE